MATSLNINGSIGTQYFVNTETEEIKLCIVCVQRK